MDFVYLSSTNFYYYFLMISRILSPNKNKEMFRTIWKKRSFTALSLTYLSLDCFYFKGKNDNRFSKDLSKLDLLFELFF